METITLYVNSMTHHALARDEVREAFVREAVGKEVWLRSVEYNGGTAVAAIVDDRRIGNVARVSRALALRALRGEGRRQVRGHIVEAQPYMLTVQVTVSRLADEEPPASSLAEWAYSGPLMDELPEVQQMEYLEDALRERLLAEPLPVESIVRGVEAYCGVATHDLSTEALSMRTEMIGRLEASGDNQLKAAAARLHEMSQRLGGDHGMEAVGQWMKNELTETAEAQLMVARTSYSTQRSTIVAEAERLPQGLYTLWRTDATMFARTLYNMSPTRQQLRRVLSCLVWIDTTAEGAKNDDRQAVSDLVDAALEMDSEEVTTSLEVLLARVNDRAEGCYANELRRLRRWKEDGTAQPASLPDVLNNDEALALLRRAQNHGLLDERWQPTGELDSKIKASVLAALIADKLKLEPFWEPFEMLWQANNLRVAYSQAQNANYYPKLYKLLVKIIG